jgi:hypothetical protein
MQSEQHDLRHALSELRFNFHWALAGRFRFDLPDDRELRRLIAREPDERKTRAAGAAVAGNFAMADIVGALPELVALKIKQLLA